MVSTIQYDADANTWNLRVGERTDSTHPTKQDAIDAAKAHDAVTRVLAFTKGNSNFRTIQC